MQRIIYRLLRDGSAGGTTGSGYFKYKERHTRTVRTVSSGYCLWPPALACWEPLLWLSSQHGDRRADGSSAGPAAITVALLAAHSSQRGCHQQARSARAWLPASQSRWLEARPSTCWLLAQQRSGRASPATITTRRLAGFSASAVRLQPPEHCRAVSQLARSPGNWPVYLLPNSPASGLAVSVTMLRRLESYRAS